MRKTKLERWAYGEGDNSNATRVCVYSRLLPRGRVITRRQSGNPKGTCGTYIGFVKT